MSVGGYSYDMMCCAGVFGNYRRFLCMELLMPNLLVSIATKPFNSVSLSRLNDSPQCISWLPLIVSYMKKEDRVYRRRDKGWKDPFDALAASLCHVADRLDTQQLGMAPKL